MKKLYAHIINQNLNDHLFFLKLMWKCITGLLQIRSFSSTVLHAAWMYRNKQYSKFCTYFSIKSIMSRRCSLVASNSVRIYQIIFPSDVARDPNRFFDDFEIDQLKTYIFAKLLLFPKMQVFYWLISFC